MNKQLRAEVATMQIDGNFDLRRLYPDSYSATISEFARKGIPLPDPDVMELKKETDLWLLLSPVKITITFSEPGLGTAIYAFAPGFITDLASVPPMFRSLADDDAREVIPAAFVHDANFDGHYCEFAPADRIFRGMIRKKGGSWWDAAKYYLGVISPVGWWLYHHRKASRAGWATKYVSVTWPAASLAK